MSRERELLDKLLDAYDYRFLRLNGGPEYQCVIEEIRAYLAEQKQYDALADRYVEGVTGGLEKCREYMEAQVWVAKELLKTPEPTIGAVLPNGAVVTNVYESYEEGLKEHAPRPEFVRLSEEEICKLWTLDYINVGLWVIAYTRSIEDALEEKNRG